MKLRELFEARFPTDAELAAATQSDDADLNQMSPYSMSMSGAAATPFYVYQAVRDVLGDYAVFDEDDIDGNKVQVYVWEGTREGFYIGNDDGPGGSIEIKDLYSKQARNVAIAVHEAYHAYIDLKTAGQGRLSSQEKIVNNLAAKWLRKHLTGMALHVALEAINASRVNYGHNHMPNPSPQDLRELFDRALPYEWDQGHHYAIARAIDRQGATLETVFTSNEDGMLDIEFQRGGSMATTGNGDEYIIFSTVIKAIREYMNKNPGIRIVYFSGDDDRISLYSKLADKLAAEFGFTKTLKGKRVFKLIKNKPVNESKSHLNKLHNPKIYQAAVDQLNTAYGDPDGKDMLDTYSQAVDQLVAQGGAVYRAVWIMPGEKPNLDNPGDHWSLSLATAEEYLETNAGVSAFLDLKVDDENEPTAYILQATVGPNNITNKNVLVAEFIDEQEVNIVNTGQAKFKIVKKLDKPW